MTTGDNMTEIDFLKEISVAIECGAFGSIWENLDHPSHWADFDPKNAHEDEVQEFEDYITVRKLIDYVDTRIMEIT